MIIALIGMGNKEKRKAGLINPALSIISNRHIGFLCLRIGRSLLNSRQ